MFTDKNLITLHKCKEYKVSNSFCKNFTYTISIVKAGAGGISLSFSSKGTPSVTVNIIAVFWFILRFLYITKEFTDCRAKIIESLLNKEFSVDNSTLIKNSIKANSMWMEYKKDKVEFLEIACINYLDSPENRTLLCSKSDIPHDQSIEVIQKVHAEITDIFKVFCKELILYELRIAMLEYSDVVQNQKFISQLQNIFTTNSKTGNLTNKEAD